jgi:predicted MFS family arabinose efflux permease
MNPAESRSLWIKLFLPFAAGYFLSYLFRTVNAVIGPVLARELAIGDNALGLLTSTYFLAFGLAQLPLGMLLDRFGPRRVESGLLLLAATGAATFALADDIAGLAVGRALIGLGVSACLMASFKAFSQWFPPERQASLTGWIMASGGLGALAAARPLEFALGFTGWREIALALAATTLAVAATLWLVVPDKPGDGKGAGLAEQLAGVRAIFSSRHFWRYAPMGLLFTGGFMAVQGLWASRWMAVLEGMSGPAIAARLTWMSGAMLAGFLFMGFFATGLVRRGIKLERIYLGAMLVALACFALISARPTWASCGRSSAPASRCPTSLIRWFRRLSRPPCPGAPTPRSTWRSLSAPSACNGESAGLSMRCRPRAGLSTAPTGRYFSPCSAARRWRCSGCCDRTAAKRRRPPCPAERFPIAVFRFWPKFLADRSI